MKKLKPKRIDWYLLGICLVFVLCWLVPSLIDTNNYMQHPDIRITHDNCHLVRMKEAIEKWGWVSATCRYFFIYYAGCLVFIFLPFSIAARWLGYIRRHLKSWMQLLLLTLVIASAIVIICIDPWYFLYAYLLLWLIDIVYVIAKLARYLYYRWKAYKSTTTLKERRKHLCITLIALLVACVAIAVTCDALVKINAKGSIYDRMDDIPHNKVGLLLGTAPFTPSGEHNYYFDYRIEAASALFHAGKVEYILVSGDSHAPSYNEPSWMRDSLMAHGVPPQRILLDYAGFRTIDSMIRAKDVFGQDSITIISQQFHNERALYLARRCGIHAVAFNAKDVSRPSKWLKIHSREVLARIKMFIDITIGRQLLYRYNYTNEEIK